MNLSRDDFLRRFGSTFSAIFSGRPISDGAFRCSSWSGVLLSGNLRSFDSRHLVAFTQALVCVSDDEIIATETETDERHDVSTIATVSQRMLRDVAENSDIGFFAFSAVFGKSGRWGLVVEEDYMCLSGDDGFMDSFISAVGGLNVLKRQFLQIVEREWSGSLEHRDQVIAAVGWLSSDNN